MQILRFSHVALVSLARARETVFSKMMASTKYSTVWLKQTALYSVRRAGGMTAVGTMNHFMLNKEMIVVGSTYWNMVYGKEIGDVLNDEEGMANMRNLGQNMIWLLKRLDKQG